MKNMGTPIMNMRPSHDRFSLWWKNRVYIGTGPWFRWYEILYTNGVSDSCLHIRLLGPGLLRRIRVKSVLVYKYFLTWLLISEIHQPIWSYVRKNLLTDMNFNVKINEDPCALETSIINEYTFSNNRIFLRVCSATVAGIKHYRWPLCCTPTAENI